MRCFFGALQFWPNKRFPKKVYIFFYNEGAKSIMKPRGIDLFGSHIDLDEPGSGLIRVEIQNVLYSIPNYVIWDWLSNFGDVVDVKNDTHKFKNGRLITWGTGVRFGYVKHVKEKIPPYAAVLYKGRNLHMSIWYAGITEMFCRHCRQITPKGHQCTLAPRKRCFKCNSENHMQSESGPDQGGVRRVRSHPLFSE